MLGQVPAKQTQSSSKHLVVPQPILDCATTPSLPYATKIQTSPKLLANTSLSLTLETSRSSSALMKRLSKTPKLSPREAAALSDCLEVLTDSVDELQRSIGEMNSAGGSNFELQMNDIQTWVSAALTDDNTCMDGFSETSMKGNAKIMVRSNVLKVAHMTSNSLALVNNYATAQSFSPNVVP
ncbi:hypothetical protein L1049_006702 [Liquidambar formosana]|uniref:Pectinesterase inhibitor domain-containing protein n=1 Tax=Liquidambar formosana TaxID=63359 RepID=A0AAP0WUI9_LIQFO